MSKPKDKIDPNQIKVRDPLMLEIIRGVTKAGVQKDKKKEKSKRQCRRKVNEEE